MSSPTLSEAEIKRILRVRERARTDLLFLCNKLLDYPDVSPEIHHPTLNLVQKFDHVQGTDTLSSTGKIRYIPIDREPNKVIPRTDPRRRLLMDFRSSLKTTVNIIAHSIQWILNFPDVSILIIHASEGKAVAILKEIKDHFTGNAMLRYYFPEFCAHTPRDVRLFGNATEFTVPARIKLRKEPTVTVGAVEKKMASAHYHVIKFTDVVEETNAANEEQRTKVAQKFGQSRFLLIDPHHWIDVEGTRYHMGDLYGSIIRNNWFKIVDPVNGKERDREAHERMWAMSIRGVYRKIGVTQDFSPDFIDAPYLIEDGHKVSWWPVDRDGRAKFDLATLEAMRVDPTIGEAQFACQYLNNPLDTSDLRTFPLTLMRWMSADAIKRVPTDFHIVSVDTASTIKSTSNDSVISTCKWDTAGRQILVECSLGKYQPDEIVKEVFVHVLKYRPLAVYIEETEFVRGFKANFLRMAAKLNVFPNFVFLTRDTHTSKIERIEKTLQPPFKHGFLRFSEDLPEHVKERLKVELSEFPLGSKDDILDTLADQYQERDHFTGRARPQMSKEDQLKRAWEKMVETEFIENVFGEQEAQDVYADLAFD